MSNKIWIGSPVDVRQGEDAQAALAHTSDAKYWDEQNGIVEVDHERWQAAQQFESVGWLRCWKSSSSDRNDYHKAGFYNYKLVPQNLGKVIEIGCGPFTQLKTIAEGRNVESVTLLDPLINQYPALRHCTYRHGSFNGLPTTLICDQAENLDLTNQFDTAICINVLEHVENVGKVLSNLSACLKTGGIVIFGERCYDNLNINEVYDVGHPIRAKMKVFLDWEKYFEPLLCIMPKNTDPLNQEHYFIGRKRG